MLVNVNFKINSDVKLDDFWDIQYCNATYSFHVDENDILNKITISVKTNTIPRLIPGASGEHQVNIPKMAIDKCIELAKKLNAASSSISLNGYIEIGFENYDATFEPENDEEKKLCNVFTWNKKFGESEAHILPFDLLARTVFFSEDSIELETPLLLFKNSKKHYINRDFRLSFYEAYFFLEYMYGNGKTDNKKVCAEFLNHPILITAINHARNDVMAISKKDNSEFINFLRNTNDVAEILNKIIHIRGTLFHQSIKRKSNWSPGDSEVLVNEAMFMQSVCGFISYELSDFFGEKYIGLFHENNKAVGVQRKFKFLATVKKDGETKNISFDRILATKKLGLSTLTTFAFNIEGHLSMSYDEIFDFKIILGDMVIYKKENLDSHKTDIDGIL